MIEKHQNTIRYLQPQNIKKAKLRSTLLKLSLKRRSAKEREEEKKQTYLISSDVISKIFLVPIGNELTQILFNTRKD